MAPFDPYMHVIKPMLAESRDPVRLEGPDPRAEMGRDPGPRDRARRPAVSESSPVVRRVAVSGPRGPHAEAGDPGRGDRGHERSAAELREAPTAGAGERQDQDRPPG